MSKACSEISCCLQLGTWLEKKSNSAPDRIQRLPETHSYTPTRVLLSLRERKDKLFCALSSADGDLQQHRRCDILKARDCWQERCKGQLFQVFYAAELAPALQSSIEQEQLKFRKTCSFLDCLSPARFKLILNRNSPVKSVAIFTLSLLSALCNSVPLSCKLALSALRPACQLFIFFRHANNDDDDDDDEL